MVLTEAPRPFQFSGNLSMPRQILEHQLYRANQRQLAPSMRVICAWCKTVLKEGSSSRISHGMCDECSFTFRNGTGMGLRSLLENLEVPTLVFRGDATLIAGNRAAKAVLPGSSSCQPDAAAGVVIECERSALPGGCGKSEFCSACQFRNTIAATHSDGTGRHGVVSGHPMPGTNGSRTVRYRFSTRKVGENVQVFIEDRSTNLN